MSPAPVRVGVTGHRVLAEVDRVTAGVDAALARIAALFPGRAMTAVTALAEGADRLVAERVLGRDGGAIEAVLPLAPDVYEADFDTPDSRRAFRALLARAGEMSIEAPASSRDAAYARAGARVLDRSDVLIAVWDGRPSQGGGGTAEIVALARTRGLPLAWVRAGNRRPGTEEPQSLGPDQGRVTYERM